MISITDHRPNYRTPLASQRRHSISKTKPWEFEGLVVRFVPRPAPSASFLDLALRLETNVREHDNVALRDWGNGEWCQFHLNIFYSVYNFRFQERTKAEQEIEARLLL